MSLALEMRPESCFTRERLEKINKYQNEMKLEVISKSSNEAFVRVAIAAFASQLDPTIEQIADIKTAVSEAITNCIIHAYENSDGIIRIYAGITQDSIEIEILDYGKGIENIEMARQTLYTSKPDADRSRNGLHNNGEFYGRAES